MANDKFIQPVDGIQVTQRADGPRTILSEEVLEAGRERIAAGEYPEDVALDLAIYESSLLEGLD